MQLPVAHMRDYADLLWLTRQVLTPPERPGDADPAAAEIAAAAAESAATLAPPRPVDRSHVGERLGDALLRHGLISPADLDHALAEHRTSGERLGRVILSMGLVRRQDLHRVLGEIWGIDYCDLLDADVDEALVRRFDPKQMALEGWVPVGWHGDHVRVATAEPPDPELAATFAAELGGPIEIEFLATTEWDVNAVLRRIFAERLAHDAANEL
jgi:hypothetical protein